MAERSLKTFSKSTALALTLLFLLYCISGTFGYLTFGSNVAADLMQMFDAKDPIVAAGIH
jgi:sodium-coupled neutral amino acid transporter 7/8